MTKIFLLLLVLVGLLASGCKSGESTDSTPREPLPTVGGGGKDPRDAAGN